MAGCAELSYYGQAVRGQLQVIGRSRPIQEVLQDHEKPLEAGLRQALEGVPEILLFAEQEMSLSAGKSYRSYADLERPYVVWNVFAAGEFDFEPKRWSYPLVGRLAYRGYFSRQAAEECAARLERRGYDVLVAGVVAYSTLGWFGDPVLNTFVGLPRPALAALICHELAHARQFFPGDTALSEAFATVVEEEALERWLAREGTEEEGLRYLRRKLEVSNRIREEFRASRARLTELYACRDQLGDDEIRARKAVVFASLEERCVAIARLLSPEVAQRLAGQPFNNARLSIDDSYRRLVPPLREILEVECGGDLRRFYREMEKVASGRRPRPGQSDESEGYFRRSILKKSRMTLR